VSDTGPRRGLLVRGGTVLDPEAPLEPADVRIAADTIVEVGPGLRPEGEDVLDATDRLVMPGLINAHTHSGQNLDRGLVPNLPLDLWIMWAVYGGVQQSPEDAYTTAAAGALEMLRTGCTAVLDQAWIPTGDFEAHSDAIMSAYADLGLRAAVAAMVQDRDFYESLPLDMVPDHEPPAPLAPPENPERLADAVAGFIDRWTGKADHLIPMPGPSAPQRCSDEFLSRIAAIAEARGTNVHTHLLETKSQVFATRNRYSRPVLEHLGTLGLLGQHMSFAHCVWLDGAEYETLRAAGSVLVHNPISNLRCGSGLMPLGHLLRRGLRVALGADGAASNDNQNMFEAMKFGTLIHTLYGDHPEWPRAHEVWEACLKGGSAAIGQRLGTIAPGAKADLVVLALDRHVLRPKEEMVASLVMAEHGESVQTVVVGGRVVVQDGRSTRVSEEELGARRRAFMLRANDEFDRRRDVYGSVESLIAAMLDEVAARDLPVHRLAAVDGFDLPAEP
jgi:5-methylthioadenosine/S-adenosylhomocysteine deaminase